MPKLQRIAGFVATLAIAIGLGLVHPAATAATGATAPTPAGKRAMLERGRYLVDLGSCNDCHTRNFAPSDGKLPEKEWLLGDGSFGFSGPWGTTYAPNLRLSLSKLSESEWVKYAKALKTRPPMPWFNLNRWKDADLRAFYQYVRSLGPAGEPVTNYLPPGTTPSTPVLQWPAPPKK